MLERRRDSKDEGNELNDCLAAEWKESVILSPKY